MTVLRRVVARGDLPVIDQGNGHLHATYIDRQFPVTIVETEAVGEGRFAAARYCRR